MASLCHRKLIKLQKNTTSFYKLKNNGLGAHGRVAKIRALPEVIAASHGRHSAVASLSCTWRYVRVQEKGVCMSFRAEDRGEENAIVSLHMGSTEEEHRRERALDFS